MKVVSWGSFSFLAIPTGALSQPECAFWCNKRIDLNNGNDAAPAVTPGENERTKCIIHLSLPNKINT